MKHYINATDTITLLKEHTIDASDTKILGPFIIQNGQKSWLLRKQQAPYRS